MNWQNEIKKQSDPYTKIIHSPMSKEADKVMDILAEAYMMMYKDKELQERFWAFHSGFADEFQEKEDISEYKEKASLVGFLPIISAGFQSDMFDSTVFFPKRVSLILFILLNFFFKFTITSLSFALFIFFFDPVNGLHCKM